MGATFSRLKNWSTGESLTASQLNAEFNNILNGLDPTGIDDESANDAAAQATSDPYAGSSLVKATSLEKEIQQIRYLLAQITGKTYWYIDPDDDIASIVVDIAALNTFLASLDLTNHGVLVGSGTSPVTPLAAMTNGQLVVGATGADPAPQTMGGDATLAANGTLSLASGRTFPAGTIMLFGQNSAPTGWTKKTDWQDNAMLCYATGNIGSGGSVNPQSTHTHTTPDHTLTVNEMPAHTHADTAYDAGTTTVPGSGNSAAGSRGITSDSTGGGAAHNHGDTGANSAPYYQEVIAATKD